MSPVSSDACRASLVPPTSVPVEASTVVVPRAEPTRSVAPAAGAGSGDVAGSTRPVS